MKVLSIIFILLYAFHLNAKSYKHMISFGTQGLAWSGDLEQVSGNKSSHFKRVDYFYHNLSLNYAYLISRRFQFGGFYQNTHKEYQFHAKESSSSPLKVVTDTGGLFTLYNFSDQIMDAYYLGLSFAIFNEEEENSKEFNDAEGKAPFELDDKGEIIELIFGKRTGLKHWNIDHITYAPQIGVYYKTHSKDFKDNRLTRGVGIRVQLIKLDILF
jgi:hypothetical protein